MTTEDQNLSPESPVNSEKENSTEEPLPSPDKTANELSIQKLKTFLIVTWVLLFIAILGMIGFVIKFSLNSQENTTKNKVSTNSRIDDDSYKRHRDLINRVIGHLELENYERAIYLLRTVNKENLPPQFVEIRELFRVVAETLEKPEMLNEAVLKQLEKDLLAILMMVRDSIWEQPNNYASSKLGYVHQQLGFIKEIKKAQNLYQEKKFFEAIKTLKTIPSDSPLYNATLQTTLKKWAEKQSTVFINNAKTLMNQNKFTEAIEVLEKAIILGVQYSKVYGMRQECLENIKYANLLEEARVLYEEGKNNQSIRLLKQIKKESLVYLAAKQLRKEIVVSEFNKEIQSLQKELNSLRVRIEKQYNSGNAVEAIRLFYNTKLILKDVSEEKLEILSEERKEMDDLKEKINLVKELYNEIHKQTKKRFGEPEISLIRESAVKIFELEPQKENYYHEKATRAFEKYCKPQEQAILFLKEAKIAWDKKNFARSRTMLQNIMAIKGLPQNSNFKYQAKELDEKIRQDMTIRVNTLAKDFFMEDETKLKLYENIASAFKPAERGQVLYQKSSEEIAKLKRKMQEKVKEKEN